MKTKLKKSASSSNFWNNVSTIALMLVSSLATYYTSNPEMLKNITLGSFASVALYNLSNVLSHMMKADNPN